MTDEFFDTPTRELNFVPFDIETTGFKASDGDFVTNVILHNNDEYHIWINTNDSRVSAADMEAGVKDGSGFDNVQLYVCGDERELLDNVGDYLSTHTDDNTILTAFNGETYRGTTDFDVPFLRTRCFRTGLPWILDGLWYADVYEVFSDSSRFDTTVKAEPTLDSMNRGDIIQFARDFDFDISPDKMGSKEIGQRIEEHEDVTFDMVECWALEEGLGEIDSVYELNKTPKQRFIDDKGLDISYAKLGVDGLKKAIREKGFRNKMLIEWHEETGRSIGTEEATTLDDIHEKMIEDIAGDEELRRSLPFDLEVFDPFDPFESSGEAVTSYMEGDFTGVILHCLADVARTVNMNRIMAEYAPKKEFRPKIL